MASRADKLELDQADPTAAASSGSALNANIATMSSQEKAELLARIDDNESNNGIDAPFDNKLLLALLGVPGSETGANTGDDESQQAAAHSYITEMLLPLKAIAGCTTVEPESDSEDDASDFESDEAPPRRLKSDNDPVKAYIFPPSPLTPEDDDDEDLPESAQVLATKLNSVFGPDTAGMLKKAARISDANVITLPRKWSDEFRRFEASIQPRDGSLVSSSPLERYNDSFLSSSSEEFVIHSVDGSESASCRAPPDRLTRHLLCLHACISFILHKTGAGRYIDSILSDTTDREDLDRGGETLVGLLLQLRLDGWYSKPRRRQQQRDGFEGTAESFQNLGDSGIWIDRAQFIQEE